MPVGVIDLLQVVDIKHRQGHCRRLSQLETGNHPPSIEKARRMIGICLLFDQVGLCSAKKCLGEPRFASNTNGRSNDCDYAENRNDDEPDSLRVDISIRRDSSELKCRKPCCNANKCRCLWRTKDCGEKRDCRKDPDVSSLRPLTNIGKENYGDKRQRNYNAKKQQCELFSITPPWQVLCHVLPPRRSNSR